MKAHIFTATTFDKNGTPMRTEFKSHTTGELPFVNRSILSMLDEAHSVLIQLSPFHSAVISKPAEEDADYFDLRITKAEVLAETQVSGGFVKVNPETGELSQFTTISENKTQYFKTLAEVIFEVTL